MNFKMLLKVVKQYDFFFLNKTTTQILFGNLFCSKFKASSFIENYYLMFDFIDYSHKKIKK